MDDLIRRLESAEGPALELDREIYVLANGWILAGVPADYDGENAGKTYVPPQGISKDFRYPPKGKVGLYYHVPDRRYTGSIDASLPWENILEMRWLGEGVCEAWHFSTETQKVFCGRAKTEPLARRIAALRARETKGA